LVSTALTSIVSTSGASESSSENPRASLAGCSSSKSQPIRPRSRFVAATYALINIDDAETGLLSPPRTTIPYSVSIPHTLGSAMT
jgi:hypothetical protein